MTMLLSLFNAILLLSITNALLITNDSILVANKAYEYVIVGGGTAGLVVAHRLTEANRTVLVIEAGMDQQNLTAINDPGQEVPSTYLNPDLDWLYPTVPQQHNRSLTLPAGKCLGGSTCINNMMLSRGTVDQYDGWEKLGNPTWNFASMQGFMKKSEAFQVPDANQNLAGARYDPDAHGFDGPVFTGFDNPLLNTDLLQASIDVFLNSIPNLVNRPDFASGHPNGASWWAYTIHPGATGTIGGNRRSTSAVSYVYPFQSENLSILVGHQAARILWDSKTNKNSVRATGVEFLPIGGGDVARVTVLKEVIVSAGTFGSPRFLELSGVGNRTILERVGVNVMIDLPAVGTNFQEQPAIASLSFAFGPNNLTLKPDPNGNGLVSTTYLDYKQVFANESKAGNFAQEFINTIPERASEIVRAGGFASVEGLEAAFRVQAASMTNSLAPVVEIIHGITPNESFMIPFLLIPSSRGTVHIVSTNPLVLPAINPTMLTNPVDLKLFIQAVKNCRTYATAPPIGSLVTVETSPGLDVVPKNASDVEWEDWIFDNYITGAHAVGTVPMLPRTMGGAVDPELRVYGTVNVRVADLSIVPIHLSAHTSSTAYGVGEKAADVIIRGGL